MTRLWKIRGVPQFYSWGSPARDSLVAKLGGLLGTTGVSEETPCAELWFGAHPNAPSPLVIDSQRTLAQLLSTDLVGDSQKKSTQEALPFLLKVLDINSVLSIQAHPNRELARKLHRQDPNNFPDDNHKPEIGIALSTTRLLYGFKKEAEMQAFIQLHPDFEKAVQELVSSDSGARIGYIERLVRTFYSLTSLQVETLNSILYKSISKRTDLDANEALFMKLWTDHPHHDVGLLIALLLNQVELQRFEGVFIRANVPHAYLSGQLVECMANSDNVVRAGLTSKHQDRETLLGMLDFKSEYPNILKAGSKEGADVTASSSGVAWYPRLCDEFQLGLIDEQASIQATGPMILLSIDGDAEVCIESESCPLLPGEAVYLHGSAATVSVRSATPSLTVVAR